MSSRDSARTYIGASPMEGLRKFTATSLATDISSITREVARSGAAVITKHDEPTMVLVSIDRYIEMHKAGAPNLDALTQRFEAMYAAMQAPGVAEATIDALDLDAASTKSSKRLPRRRK